MSKAFFLTTTAQNSGLTSVTYGLVYALERLGVNVGVFQPISYQVGHDDNSKYFAKVLNIESDVEIISLSDAQMLMSENKGGLLMERIVANYEKVAAKKDVIVVEGIPNDRNEAYLTRLNIDIAQNLNAPVILVADVNQRTPTQLSKHLKVAASLYHGTESPDVLGVVLNRVGEISDEDFSARLVSISDLNVFTNNFHLIGAIPLLKELAAPRVSDLKYTLEVNSLNEGESDYRRIYDIVFAAKTVDNIIPRLTPGTLVVTPSDRSDVIVAACMAGLSGIPLAGILLTSDSNIDPRIHKLCAAALKAGLPLLSTPTDTFRTAAALANLNRVVQVDDEARMRQVVSMVSEHLDLEWLAQVCAKERKSRLSPPAFRHMLTSRARSAKKRIVLPEGNEPRTVAAAIACQERNIAQCVMIGERSDISSVAEAQGLTFLDEIEVINPDEVRERYVPHMVEARKHKGLAPDMARSLLEDNVVLATMMVALDEVDGLVSGAVHTTANTVRPALQLIKTAPSATVVSSVFFMCLPEQVLVYGDCAINPDPNAEELADIAIQSADSALAFGIEPKVAMISYSTGASGAGADVEKVKQATEIAKARRPDLLIDGPLQYDAAAIESVAAKKAPNSPVAGQATVFIFPDLNTGNTTYKAVQRSANVISMGPMLQGLNKPVNDLSRGALVDDIIYTIALTAIQSKQADDAKEQAQQ
ncbi:phosphate acetyltransferase [Oleiphilus sp. HI0009]|uniref:phosphate acetyltransferase n=2 Tax=Oleiphilus TaxID=141450 RepID=UPI0007C2F84F|nr:MULTISPECIES: phosphate acetyltransferase [unclassified Oleiphilus]KZX77520.1 phosphate acetyltransferase [Oleiphilus sp. HI0009]KZY65545.1 phosphate acetyltransferase [Oleiphilus sp. HI0066]KZY67992.1 phosphate acetyltransferase [Oleiphilus sp. HI0067]